MTSLIIEDKEIIIIVMACLIMGVFLPK